MSYIRGYYGVPAKRGSKVLACGKPGTIVGSRGAYIRVKLDEGGRIRSYHPTWEITYF